jgi:hypothetical protein
VDLTPHVNNTSIIREMHIPSLPLGYDLLRPKLGLEPYPRPRFLAEFEETMDGRGAVTSARLTPALNVSAAEVPGEEYLALRLE